MYCFIQLVYAYEQIAQALRYAAKACDEFQALIPRDVGIIPGDLGVSSQSIGSQRKFKKPQIKDPNAPKRPNTAYILFSNEIRADTKAANPHANQKEIVTLIGQKWKALSREEKKVILKCRNKLELSRFFILCSFINMIFIYTIGV